MTNSDEQITEIYKKWEPIKSIPASLYCEGIHDDYEGFRILLKGEDQNASILRIKFESALAYRNVEDGKRSKTQDLLSDAKDFSLYTVINSKWLNWFSEENYGMYDGLNLVHYAILSLNDWIDVLSAEQPIVTWI
jgi:hypothetical protein